MGVLAGYIFIQFTYKNVWAVELQMSFWNLDTHSGSRAVLNCIIANNILCLASLPFSLAVRGSKAPWVLVLLIVGDMD